ncbi:hypothetical protein B0T25DRAFT_598046 [Lasiosphaeria hispida]|uniref:Uncharacterized protein n=1 Tax=Lasiosphaeria hispida TaxID=260671 RepID=A0AAJ0HWG6_9PEZI|nr:hypothetical protein B0T25DRAFT_598046 [Lasiosphaeria hispida]
MKEACKLEDQRNDCIISFSVPFLVALISNGTCSLDDINKGLGTKLQKEEFEASVSTILSKVQCILGIPYLPAKDQDASSGQRQHENTGPGVISLFSSLPTALAQAPEEADREHVLRAGPEQITSQREPGMTFTSINAGWRKTTSKQPKSDNGGAGKKQRKASKPAGSTRKRSRHGAFRSVNIEESQAAPAQTGEEGDSQAHTPNTDDSVDGHRPTTGTQTANVANGTRHQLEPAENHPGSTQPEDHDADFTDAVETGQDSRSKPSTSSFTQQGSENQLKFINPRQHGEPTSLPECSTQLPPGTINLATIHPLQAQCDDDSLSPFVAVSNHSVVELDHMFGRPYDDYPNLTEFEPDNPVDLGVMFGEGPLVDGNIRFQTDAGENDHPEGTDWLGVDRYFREHSSSPFL